MRLLSYRTFAAAPVDDFTSLHSAALADGHSAVQRIRKLDVYAASLPIFSATGDVIALIEARLPTAENDAATGELVRRLLLTALLLGIIAIFGGVILGELVAGPVRALTRAALRLGEGDFPRPSPHAGPPKWACSREPWRTCAATWWN